MSSNSRFPDYELAEQIEVSLPGQLRAFADPLRVTILDLLLERAATVRDLAAAVGRPRSTVAYHVKVLVDAGMLRVVRTRRVRAIEERHYGRTARMFAIGVVDLPGGPVWANALSVAAAESGPAHGPTGCVRCTATYGSPTSVPPSSGSGSRRSPGSSPNCRAPATPSTASSPASIRPTTPPFPDPGDAS